MKDNDINPMHCCRPIWILMMGLRSDLGDNMCYDPNVMEYDTSAQYGGQIMDAINAIIMEL